MKKHKILKIIIYTSLTIFGILILSLIFGWFFIKPWAAKKLDLAINENNRSSYFITYSDFDLNLLTRTATFTNLNIKPKSDTLNNLSIVNATIDRITISGIEIYPLLKNNFIATKIHLDHPNITAKKGPKNAKDTLTVKSFNQFISLDNLEIQNGSLKLQDSLNKNNLAYIKNLQFSLQQIEVDSVSLNSKIPFRFTDYQISYDSLYAKINPFYTINTLETTLNNKHLEIRKLNLKPIFSKVEFQRQITKETDLFSVKKANLALNNIQWKIGEKGLEFTAEQLQIDSLSAEVYRNKSVADDTSIKPLFSKKLRDLPFYLAIDTLNIKDSSIEYIEQIDFNTEASHIKFRAFNAHITDILSGSAALKIKKKTKIKVNSLFMGAAPLHVNWTFDVNNTADSFTFSGSINELPSAQLNTFLRPQINATTTGTLNQVFFNIYGNNQESKGDFKIKYHDFKIEFLRKNGKEKNKFLSAIGNLFVRKDTDETFNEAEIEQVRNKEKSFFNFMWISLADGLKKTFLITNSKHSEKEKE